MIQHLRLGKNILKAKWLKSSMLLNLLKKAKTGEKQKKKDIDEKIKECLDRRKKK